MGRNDGGCRGSSGAESEGLRRAAGRRHLAGLAKGLALGQKVGRDDLRRNGTILRPMCGMAGDDEGVSGLQITRGLAFQLDAHGAFDHVNQFFTGVGVSWRGRRREQIRSRRWRRVYPRSSGPAR